MKSTIKTLALVLSPLLLAACGTAPTMTAKAPVIDNAALPAAVRVPAGQKQAVWSTTQNGQITYECRLKLGTTEAFEWTFAGPVADLVDANGVKIGKYYAGPTWEANDGSKFTGKQLAVSPAAAGNIPLQLVQANPSTGQGAFAGTTFVQRLNTKGGVAPSQLPCTKSSLGQRVVVSYASDYVLYRAN